MRIALIPARGGSKRIPRKNIKEFCGKPIIEYSIQAALNSECFDKVIVSTDDEEIADISVKLGAEVPFIRPAEVADDFATTADVILHTLDWFEQQNQEVTYLCCIYATAPFIKVEDIKNTYQMLLNDAFADYCFPVCEFPSPIQRGLKLIHGTYVRMFQPENFLTRSQDLEKSYYDAGQFYWGKPQAFRNAKPMFSESAIAYPISRNRVVDLDTPEDWEYAVILEKALRIPL